jgi:hypothetical protein
MLLGAAAGPPRGFESIFDVVEGDNPMMYVDANAASDLEALDTSSWARRARIVRAYFSRRLRWASFRSFPRTTGAADGAGRIGSGRVHGANADRRSSTSSGVHTGSSSALSIDHNDDPIST